MPSPRFLIYSPVGLKTGGPECLYQLCDALNSLGYESLIIPDFHSSELLPSKDFLKYNVNYLNSKKVYIDDVLIIPEIYDRIPKWLHKSISPANIVTWWLSVDNCPIHPFRNFEESNYQINSAWLSAELDIRSSKKIKFGKFFIVRFFNGNTSGIFWKKKWLATLLYHARNKILTLYYQLSTVKINLISHRHYAQSEYARNVVSSLTGKEVGKISDYISGAENRQYKTFRKSSSRKTIAINPFKGANLLNAFKSLYGTEMTFLELKNMDSKAISEALSESDLYLDLGHFPGKDRIPREAILEGCPVFLAKRGAARNTKDFPLPAKYKIDVQSTTPVDLKKIIDNFLDAREFESQSDFFYEQVKSKQLFLSEVLNFAEFYFRETDTHAQA